MPAWFSLRIFEAADDYLYLLLLTFEWWALTKISEVCREQVLRKHLVPFSLDCFRSLYYALWARWGRTTVGGGNWNGARLTVVFFACEARETCKACEELVKRMEFRWVLFWMMIEKIGTTEILTKEIFSSNWCVVGWFGDVETRMNVSNSNIGFLRGNIFQLLFLFVEKANF